MIPRYLKSLFLIVGMAAMAATAALAESPPTLSLEWQTVVNNNTKMPGAPLDRTFNSYNQPSVNAAGLVVIRARSVGGGGTPATHGIYTRDMSVDGSPVVRILDRTAPFVPYPNNLGTRFVETPSFPRIDIWSDTIATRGNHPPVWEYGQEPDKTHAGTTGVYANPFGSLVTGASKLGAAPGFEFFEVPYPDAAPSPWTMFDVFPGAPSVTDGSTIVFKGNFTVDGVGKTGVFYRNLENEEAGGISPVFLIASNTETLIPGTDTFFGSTSPPSAADGKAVFAGFDNEGNPTRGGLYLANLKGGNKLGTLVEIGGPVPGVRGETFSRIGEAVSFDGTMVGFWGAWGTETTELKLYCPTEGNKDRIDYCNKVLECEDGSGTMGDENSKCIVTDDKRICWQEKYVPVNQGIFVHDTSWKGSTRMVASTGNVFSDFVFWNYSGKPPCVGVGGHGQEGAEDDGEPARWRSSAFVAVSGPYTAFKAAADDRVGIYIESAVGRVMWTVLDTTMNGKPLESDSEEEGWTITELGLEREGLRANHLAINAKMSSGEGHGDGMAGVYMTHVPIPPPKQ
jgi:hypothetical protein